MNTDYLPLLIEDATQVITAITKVQRFGSDDISPVDGVTTHTHLLTQLGNLRASIECMLNDPEDLSMVIAAETFKKDELLTFGPDGTLLMCKDHTWVDVSSEHTPNTEMCLTCWQDAKENVPFRIKAEIETSDGE